MDSTDYALRVFNERAEKAGVLHLLHGQRFLELGLGDSIGNAIIAASIVAEAIIVDAAPHSGTLIHRGPDDGGTWCNCEPRIGLGRRRLRRFAMTW